MSRSIQSGEEVALDVCPLSAEIARRLQATGYTALRDVDVFVTSGVVFLQGRVPSYHMKQVAQATVMLTSGVLEVRNELDIVYPP
ncbi:MAG TPA: BON domain-containing protein [Planctomycetaceae bacterium]|jgi:osmotically-inducible protein OsmY|nr:BON domain-containing protein [Planctomycetaceae bacterium]